MAFAAAAKARPAPECGSERLRRRFPYDLGAYARSVLIRVHAAVRAEARYTAHHRSLVVQAVEDTPRAKAPASVSTPRLDAVRDWLAGRRPLPAPLPDTEGPASAPAQRHFARRNVGRIWRVT